ncbi:hypothetical protein Q7P36_004480 [Cladosporium allicinum]
MPETKTRLSFLPDFPGRDRLYRPLNADKSEVRVITIWPSRERSEPISCSLQTISLAEGRGANYYHALSYYWGSTSEGDTERITVHPESVEDRHGNGFSVPVTKQLTGALRQFRSRMESMDHPLVLWTDAVCINQLDAGERAQQVTIMRHVYEFAVDTWVWLGEADPLAEQGLASIFALSLLQLGDPERGEDLNTASAVFDDTDFDVNVDLPRLELANAFVEQMRLEDHFMAGLFASEVCANEDVVLHCGQTRCHVLDWLRFSLFCTKTFYLSDALSIISPEAKLAKATLAMIGFLGWVDHVVRSLVSSLHSGFSGGGPEATISVNESIRSQLPIDLSNLFYHGRWQTADPRDRVYAMIGYMLGFMQLGVRPNYRLPTEEVFIRTTLKLLHTLQSWSILHFIHPSASPYLPSWTIDFTLHTADTQCPGIIISAGFVYDEILAVSPVRSPLDLDREAQSFWKWWYSLTNSQNKQYISRHSAYAHEIDLWMSYCRTVCVDSEKYLKYASTFRQWKLDTSPVGVGQGLPWELHYSLQPNIFSSARLVITRRGRIGLAPLGVEPGDYIAILAGGGVPFALRKVRSESMRRDAYRLLGGCYVDGIMYGSAVFGGAFRTYTTVKRGRSSPFTNRMLRTHGLLDKNGVVKCSVGLAFPDDIALV